MRKIAFLYGMRDHNQSSVNRCLSQSLVSFESELLNMWVFYAIFSAVEG